MDALHNLKDSDIVAAQRSTKKDLVDTIGTRTDDTTVSYHSRMCADQLPLLITFF
jgi:hypothetical protein